MKDREACAADFALQRNLVTLTLSLDFLQCSQEAH